MDIRESINKIIRVLMVASKPDKEEYIMGVKITGAGIVIIGLVGFVIFLAAMFIGGTI
jgi:protein transport protein SEC61 subunit gamma and related proteins